MIDYFSKPTVSYVTIAGNQFKLDGEIYNMLKASIQEIKPIRKFFHDGKLKCFSFDNQRGKNGNYCAFCSDRFKCQQKVRLSLAIPRGETVVCAVLDINQYTFENLRSLMIQEGEENLSKLMTHMKISYDEEERKSIEFWT